MSNTPVFAIVGNIGSKKSTILKLLSSRPELEGACFLEEPVKLWEETGYLKAYYEDPKLAAGFQHMTFSSRLVSFLDVPAGTKCVITDGHVLSDRYAFTEYLHDKGHITNQQLLWHDCIFQHWKRLVPQSQVFKFIYFRGDPEKCFYRKNERGRPEEDGVGIQFLAELRDYFDKWIATLPSDMVHVVDVEAHEKEQLADVVYDIITIYDE
jgi:deoxyadenosine/deoxycytidine kinase